MSMVIDRKLASTKKKNILSRTNHVECTLRSDFKTINVAPPTKHANIAKQISLQRREGAHRHRGKQYTSQDRCFRLLQ
jgi:hypothetical protein